MAGQRVLLAILSILSINTTLAQEQIRREFGIGIGVANLPYYPGSDERRNFVVPLPYYESERLKFDSNEGVRSELFRRQRFAIDVSFNFQPSVEADDIDEREGMDDLDAILQLGPSLNYDLGPASDPARIKFKLPIRAAIATDIPKDIRHVGWVVNPLVKFAFPQALDEWDLALRVGPQFSNSTYNNYIYGVEPEFATPQRPPFRSTGGYSGMVMTLSGTKRVRNVWMGWFIRYDNLDGVKFEDSPLVVTNSALTVGFGIAWIVKQTSVEKSH